MLALIDFIFCKSHFLTHLTIIVTKLKTEKKNPEGDKKQHGLSLF